MLYTSFQNLNLRVGHAGPAVTFRLLAPVKVCQMQAVSLAPHHVQRRFHASAVLRHLLRRLVSIPYNHRRRAEIALLALFRDFLRGRFFHKNHLFSFYAVSVCPYPAALPPAARSQWQSLRRKQNEIMGGKFRAAWGKAAEIFHLYVLDRYP